MLKVESIRWIKFAQSFLSNVNGVWVFYR